MLWDGATDNWHEGDHLSRAINRAGLDGETLLEQAETDVDRIDAAIATNEADQEKAGHSGTPLMVFKGEPFFGQDRIKLLIWRLKESGQDFPDNDQDLFFLNQDGLVFGFLKPYVSLNYKKRSKSDG